MKAFFVASLIAIGFNAVAQEAKPFQWSFMALGNLATPHMGAGSHNNKPLLMGYQDLGMEWRPWIKKGKEHFFKARLLATEGAKPSADVIGDLQVFSNIEAGNQIGLFECYYQHQFNQHNTLLIGQSDLCSNFMSLDCALWFSNSSFGALPTLSINHAMPIFPTTSPSLVYTYTKSYWRLAMGVFDGNAGDTETNKYNLHPTLSKRDGAFVIAEAAYQYGDSEFDNLVASVHLHTVGQTDANGTLPSNRKPTGYYVMGQNGVGETEDGLPKYQLFCQLGRCTEPLALINSHLSMGVVTHDLCKKLSSDRIGLAMSHARLGKRYANQGSYNKKAETAFELFLETKIVGGLFFHPSLNYLVNPGASSQHGNALVSCLYVRFEL